MLRFKQDIASERIIVTLTELVTLNEPYYLFVFTHTVTKEVVAFIKSVDDDFSNYQDRYNEFEIAPSTLFLNKQVGEWHYAIYEQVSSSNDDVANTTSLLEQGKLYLERSTDFAFTKYESAVTFKTYNG